MDKNFCRQIDQESLVEKYIAGKLRGDLLEQFEQHLKGCEDHAQAVLLEKALKRGVSEFARGEIKTRLSKRLKKREDTRFMILRYAAILLVAVITPLILYYQLNVAPEEMAEALSEKDEIILSDEAIDTHEEELEEEEESPKTELKARRSAIREVEKEPVQPAPSEGSASRGAGESVKSTEDISPVESTEKQRKQASAAEDMLKSVKATAPPKIEADYPLEQESHMTKDAAPPPAIRGFSKNGQSSRLVTAINNKVAEDSSSIKECINSSLDESERQKYLLGLSIQVLDDGKIGEIKIINTTHQSSDLDSCLLKIIKTWTLSDGVGTGMVIQEITY